MTAAPHVMACMEVWGGNRAIDNGVVMPGLDAWVFGLPFQPGGVAPDAQGGDIHYVTSCATGRITRLIVADVSGHGAPVARAADALRRLMRKHSNYIDQDRLVRAVNEEFALIGEEAGGQESPGLLFATAVFATYFSPTDELSVCNAGHPRPMRYDARRRAWSMLEPEDERGGGPSNLPLGIDEGAAYPCASVRLRPDDLVLFYTDSLIEAKDAAGRMLGHDGLRRVLDEIDPSRPEVFVRSLLERIASVAGGGQIDFARVFNDDVTALLVRRNSLKPRPSIGLATLAGVRIIGDTLRSFLPGAMPAALPQIDVRSIGGAMWSRLNGHERKDPRGGAGV